MLLQWVTCENKERKQQQQKKKNINQKSKNTFKRKKVTDFAHCHNNYMYMNCKTWHVFHLQYLIKWVLNSDYIYFFNNELQYRIVHLQALPRHGSSCVNILSVSLHGHWMAVLINFLLKIHPNWDIITLPTSQSSLIPLI